MLQSESETLAQQVVLLTLFLLVLMLCTLFILLQVQPAGTALRCPLHRRGSAAPVGNHAAPNAHATASNINVCK
jgi:hypothetical protein